MPSPTHITALIQPYNQPCKHKHSATIYPWWGVGLNENRKTGVERFSRKILRTKTTQHLSSLNNLELLRCLHIILLSGRKQDFLQTRPRESQRVSLRVTQFASSSQDTLQQLALQELLCNYKQQQQRKGRRGQTLCHPLGEHHSQFHCLKIYDEVHFKWPF